MSKIPNWLRTREVAGYSSEEIETSLKNECVRAMNGIPNAEYVQFPERVM